MFNFAKSSKWEGGLEFHPYLHRALGENPTEDEVKELEEELCSKDGFDNTEYIYIYLSLKADAILVCI